MKRYKGKRCFALVLVTLLFVCMLRPSRAYAESWSDYLTVVCGLDGQNNILGIANGIVVDLGNNISAVITCSNQVWEQAAKVTSVDVLEYYPDLSMVILDYDAGIAVFECASYCGGYPLSNVTSFSQLNVGETVYYGGLDLQNLSDNLEDSAGLYENAVIDYVQSGDYVFVQLEDSFNDIYAGGPVYTESGALVGILVKGDQQALFMPMDPIVNFFNANYSGNSGGTSGGGNSGSGGSGGGGAGTGGGSGSGSGSGGTGAGGSSYTDYPSDYSASPVLSTYFIIVFFASLIAFVVSMMMYQNRELQRRAAGMEEFAGFFAGDGVPGNAPVRSVCGKGGYFNGRSLPLGQGPVIFGRDPSRCTAVYPSNTKGVSSCHCKVEISSSGAVLTDLGSTYGTFLRDGTRLTANVPCSLHSGDAFYLAEPANTFQII